MFKIQRTILVGILIAVGCMSFADFPPASRIFAKYFSESFLVRSGFQMSDGGYVLAGERWTNTLQPMIVRLNPEGARIWSKVYELKPPFGADVIKIIPVENYGFLCIGNQWNQSNNSSSYEDPLILRLDPNGNVLWKKRILGPAQDDGIGDVVRTPDGGFVVFGGTTSYDGSDDYAWITKISANGQTNWSKSFGGSGVDSFNAIAATKEGGFVVAGDSIVMKLASDFTVNWKRILTPDRYNIEAIAQDDFGNCFVAGSNWFGNQEGFVMKLDPAGNLLWKRAIRLLKGNSRGSFTKMVVTSDGIVLAGPYYTEFEVMLVKVSPEGKLIWGRILSGLGERLYSFSLNPYGGFFLLGWSDYRSYAMVTNSQALIPGCPALHSAGFSIRSPNISVSQTSFSLPVKNVILRSISPTIATRDVSPAITPFCNE